MLKKPLIIDEQIEKLRKHNIIVEDDDYARSVLSRVNYYRLTGYALQFRQGPNNSDCADETTFKMIYELYCFDARLRQTLRPYIESAEVYYKTLIGNQFSLIKCSEPPHDQHYNRDNYYNKAGFDAIVNGFANREGHYYKDSLIMQHHKSKYSGRMPLWVMLELMSFSSVSMLYSAMYSSDQDLIAREVGVGRETLGNHLHCLSILRNKCAHGARLYNTTIKPPVRFGRSFLVNNPQVKNDSVFAYLLMLVRRVPKYDRALLVEEIVKLIREYSDVIDLHLIGFSENYEKIIENNK